MSMVQATGGDGDNDDATAMGLWNKADDGTWKPECWFKSPEQMQAEARAMNNAAFAHAASMAGKHSNPPNMPWERDT